MQYNITIQGYTTESATESIITEAHNEITKDICCLLKITVCLNEVVNHNGGH